MKTLPTNQKLINFIENQDFAFCAGSGRTVVCDFDSTATQTREELIEMVQGLEITLDEQFVEEFNNDDDQGCTILNVGNKFSVAYYC